MKTVVTFAAAFAVLAGGLVWLQEAAGQEAARATVGESPTFRGGLHRTGIYPTKGLRDLSGLKWKLQTGGPVLGSPALAGGVHVGSADKHLYAIAADTGEIRWKFAAGESVENSPAVADGMVYFGSWDGHLYAVDAKTGALKWKFKTDEGVDSSPALYEGTIYFTSWDARLFALDGSTGRKRFDVFGDGQRGLYATPVVDGTVWSGRDVLHAIEPAIGKIVTTVNIFCGKTRSIPLIVDGVAFSGDQNGFFATSLRETDGKARGASIAGGCCGSSTAAGSRSCLIKKATGEG